MIRPSQQWCLQIDITNHCHLHCSNCTRMLDHRTKETSFFMSPDEFEHAVKAVRDFPLWSDPCVGIHTGRRKVVGIIGGEPLLHPRFPTLVEIMCAEIPNVAHRGLWTSKDWMTGEHPLWGPYRPVVEKLIGRYPTHDASGPSEKHLDGYINWNMHLPSMNVHHQPILVASKDVVSDPVRRWQLISQCWVQEQWSSSITPKGFFFCEVAAAFDTIFAGTGGLPLTPDVWKQDLHFESDGTKLVPKGPYAEQIKKWCESCGACVPMPGRRDSENRDDMSPSNVAPLRLMGSRRIRMNEIVIHQPAEYSEQDRQGWRPMQYVKAPAPMNQSKAARGEEDELVSARRLDQV